MVIDLVSRTTSDKGEYDEFKKSSESLIYIDNKNIKGDGAGCLDFTVGDRWFNQTTSQWHVFPEEGMDIKPNESITIETKEKLAVPLNVFGVVTGVGRNIYTGGIVSSGKIDPGFSGRLRIGFLNASRRKKPLKKGDVICACFFVQSETSLPKALSDYIDETETLPNRKGFKFKKFVTTHWDKIVTNIIAALALIVGIISLYK